MENTLKEEKGTSLTVRFRLEDGSSPAARILTAQYIQGATVVPMITKKTLVQTKKNPDFYRREKVQYVLVPIK